MPLNDSYKQIDPRVYQFSEEIDQIYTGVIKKLYIIKEINNIRDYYETIMNYKIITTTSNHISDTYFKKNLSDFNKNSISECIRYSNFIKQNLISNYCNKKKFTNTHLELEYPILKEISSAINLISNFIKVPNLNFDLIVFRINQAHNLLNNYINDVKIVNEDKTELTNFINENIINELYQYTQHLFLVETEENLYKKIFQTIEVKDEIFHIKTNISLKNTIRRSMILNEYSDKILKSAQDIFKEDSKSIISNISSIIDNIYVKAKLIKLDITKLRDLNRKLVEINLAIQNCESSSDFQNVISLIEKTFPEILKKQFIEYANIKYGQFLELNQDSIIGKYKFKMFKKDFEHLTFEVEKKLSYNFPKKYNFKNQKFEKIIQLINYYATRDN